MGSDTHGDLPEHPVREFMRESVWDGTPRIGRPQSRRLFQIGVDYFKPSGKWYTTAEFEREFRTCALPDDAPGSAGEKLSYIHDVVAHVRGLRDCGAPDSLPGLSSVGWDGAILIRQTHHQVDGVWVAEDRVPHLLMPRETR